MLYKLLRLKVLHRLNRNQHPSMKTAMFLMALVFLQHSLIIMKQLQLLDIWLKEMHVYHHSVSLQKLFREHITVLQIFKEFGTCENQTSAISVESSGLFLNHSTSR